MQEVKSNTISHVGYDKETSELRIRFTRGGEYLYRGVSPEEHAKLMAAESIGSHFQKHIRPHYTGAKQVTLAEIAS
jgi:hypothetical protein